MSTFVERPVREPVKGRLHKALEFVIKARDPAAAINKRLVAAGPGWMCGRVDVKHETITLFAIG